MIIILFCLFAFSQSLLGTQQLFTVWLITILALSMALLLSCLWFLLFSLKVLPPPALTLGLVDSKWSKLRRNERGDERMKWMNRKCTSVQNVFLIVLTMKLLIQSPNMPTLTVLILNKGQQIHRFNRSSSSAWAD